MILCTCAAVFAGAAFGQTPVSVVSQDLLRDSENRRPIDVEWLLRDNRTRLPEALSDRAPSPRVMLRHSPIANVQPQAIAHVDAPASEDSTNVNDRLVPVPVIHTGWAIVLSAVLFHFGARVLRFRRTAIR